MIYRITAQSGVQERPIVREFENRDEAEDYVQIIKREVEEGCRTWKIEPKLEVTQ
jgi:hypothetical protein